METWGCEFSDDGRYGLTAPPARITLPNVTYVPMDFLSELIDKPYCVEISHTHREHIDNLKVSIATIGVTEPCVLTIDSHSVWLFDGNHRYVAASELGLQAMPVVFGEANRNKSGKALTTLVQDLIKEAFNGTENP